jgi:CheY-like chemotaxis protein
MKTILVVDDDKAVRGLLLDILRPEKFTLLEADDGQTALEVIAKERVDLLIADRAMPGLGGLELLKALRDQGKTIPSVIISAYGEEELWGEAIALGATDYLLKPFSAAAVLKVVRKSLSGETKK